MAKNRIMYLSRMKALACLSIVILHSFNFAFVGYAVTDTQRVIAALIRNLCLWAVPCFVMATGTLMLDSNRNVTIKKLFTKLIPKMLISLVVFTFAFACFDGVATNTFTMQTALKTTWDNIITGGGWGHMWYLYLMIALYLILPIYRTVTRNAKTNELIYLAVVYFVFLSLLKTVEQLVSRDTAFYICVYTVFPLYLFLGYMIHNGHIKLSKAVYLIMTVISAGVYIGITIYGVLYNAVLADIVTKYTFPALPFMAIGVYGLFFSKENVSRETAFDKACIAVERCSFGIYLIHMALLKYIYAVLKFNSYEHGGTVTVFGITACVFIASFVIVYIFNIVLSLIKKTAKAE